MDRDWPLSAPGPEAGPLPVLREQEEEEEEDCLLETKSSVSSILHAVPSGPDVPS